MRVEKIPQFDLIKMQRTHSAFEPLRITKFGTEKQLQFYATSSSKGLRI